MPRRVRTGPRLPLPSLPPAGERRRALTRYYRAAQAIGANWRAQYDLLLGRASDLRGARTIAEDRAGRSAEPRRKNRMVAARPPVPEPEEVVLPEFVGMMNSGRGDLSVKVKDIVRGKTSE